MSFDLLLKRMKSFGNNKALIYNDVVTTYREICNTIYKYKELKYGNTDDAILSLLANLDIGATVVFPHNDTPYISKLTKAGFVIFTSGTTGEPKAVEHSFDDFSKKFNKQGKPYITLLNMRMFHIGGLDVIFNTLFNGGCLVIPEETGIDCILRCISKYKVELLPTTPTFLRLVLLRNKNKYYDLSSLKIIAYGSEPMTESLLKSVHEMFPKARLKQTYGMTELGTLKTYSKDSESTWFKLLDEYEIRDNILFIKRNDEWFRTGDFVKEENGYIQILGRETDIINVGGEKVRPHEVEEVLYTFLGIKDVLVYSEYNIILGNIVVADIVSNRNITVEEIREFCKDKLNKYKIPVKVNLVDKIDYTITYKKGRNK